MKKWQLLKSEVILKTKWLSLFKNKYQISDTTVIDDYYLIKRADFVLIVAMKGNKVILGQQYRPGTDQIYLSVPAGYIEPNEDPINAAKRELLEETGYKAKEAKLIGKLDPLPGYLKSRAFVVLCFVEGDQGEIADKDELQDIVKVDIDEAVKLIKSGEINEMQAVSAILLAREYL